MLPASRACETRHAHRHHKAGSIRHHLAAVGLLFGNSGLVYWAFLLRDVFEVQRDAVKYFVS